MCTATYPVGQHVMHQRGVQAHMVPLLVAPIDMRTIDCTQALRAASKLNQRVLQLVCNMQTYSLQQACAV